MTTTTSYPRRVVCCGGGGGICHVVKSETVSRNDGVGILYRTIVLSLMKRKIYFVRVVVVVVVLVVLKSTKPNRATCWCETQVL